MNFVLAILFIIFIIVVCLVAWEKHQDIQLLETVTSRYRGELSERNAVKKLLKMGINPRAIFHDCYIRKHDGTYTQVDLVVATSQGLLVFEIKDYSGWIFGNEHQKYWTQILSYGRQKHRFYNPVMQNNGHIKAIRYNLPNNIGIPIYSIIVFYGGCSLKKVSLPPYNHFLIYPGQIRSTVQTIMSQPVAKFEDKHEIMNVMRQAVINGTIPGIVNSQRATAFRAGQNRPQSTYRKSYRTFKRIRRLFR